MLESRELSKRWFREGAFNMTGGDEDIEGGGGWGLRKFVYFNH